MAKKPGLAAFTKPAEIDGAPVDGAVEILDMKGFLGALKEHLDPVFAEQRATWDREGAAVMARAEALGITIDSIGGNCPVQAEGSFDGQRFYFRARGDEYQFHVGPEEHRFGPDEWAIERDYGSGFDAGWMPKHEAIGFICDGVEEYRGDVA